MIQSNRKQQYIGVLATDTEVVNKTGDPRNRSVFINGENDLQYIVRCLSDDSDTAFYTGYRNVICGYEDLFPSDTNEFYKERVEREADYRAFLEEKAFLFIENTYSPREGFRKIYKAQLIRKPSKTSNYSFFYTIPVFEKARNTVKWEEEVSIRLSRNFENIEDFIETIIQGKPVGTLYNYVFPEELPFILWYNREEEEFTAIGPFKGVDSTLKGTVLRYDKLYRKDIKLEDVDDNIAFNTDFNPTVAHILDGYYETLRDCFILTHDGLELITQQAAAIIAPETTVAEGTENVTVTTEPTLIDYDGSVKDDATLMKMFNTLCERNSLFFDPKDLSNFHTAVKTGNLVILSGLSGTGKSAIVNMYGKALGLPENDNRMLMIPVRPSWNDDADLLGYVDLVHMIYRASETGFVNLLVEAAKAENEDKLYLVCFDEMNLARVEHYFSQFLSIMEKTSGTKFLRLYDEQYKDRLYNSGDYPDQIELKGNIRFVGTVNIDESTYHFADKVLDRANVIQLKVLPFNKWKSQTYASKPITEWKFSEYKNSITKPEIVHESELRAFLWELHETLQHCSTALGIGPRIVKSMEIFLANLLDDDSEFAISYREGVDIQVNQRILTKVRGSADQFETLLQGEDSVLEQLLDKYQQLSDFTACRNTIAQKKKELKIYGYCL